MQQNKLNKIATRIALQSFTLSIPEMKILARLVDGVEIKSPQEALSHLLKMADVQLRASGK